MRKSCNFSRLLPLAIFTVGIVFHSCKEEVFNAEKVKATYQDKFPVKDIDPNLEWKMTNPVAVRVSVFQDAGANYTIRVYDGNPLANNSTAKLLSEGTANNNLSFITTMDCPSILKEVFVCCIDDHNRAIVKYETIINNQLKVSFGTPAVTRAVTQGVEIPAIKTYSPSRTAAQLEELLGTATEITDNTNFEEGSIYKISKNTTYTGAIQKQLKPNNPAILIVAGEWKPKNNIELEDGYELYILKGGSIALADHTLMMKLNTRYTVYEGGKISGASKSSINVTNASSQQYNYNAGIIDVHTIQNGGNTPTFYNDRTGTFKVPEFQLNTQNAQFINHGIAELGNTHENLTIQNGNQITVTLVKGKFINQGKAIIGSTTYNCDIENACNLTITGECRGNLTLGNNSGTTINEYPGDNSNKITLGNNCIITIQKAAFVGTFNGSDKPSLIKVKELTNIQLGQEAVKGNIYFEFEKFNESWTQENWRHMNALTYFSKWGEAPVVIPSGDCTGTGNTPSEGTGTPDNPINYTYAFEDNYPQVGDYDFNDIVLDVALFHEREKSTNNITKTHINVTLAALGATKTLGAGLRLIDGGTINNIKNITTAGKDKDRFEATLKDQNSLIKYSADHKEAGNKNIVIPLFGNAHLVYENIEAGKMVNTSPSGLTSRTYTYEIIIEYADGYQEKQPWITKDNLDLFICYQYQHMDKRMEVHLYEFWNQGATAAGTVQQENLDLAGNNTWAISVPNFRYPKERTNICNKQDNNDCAYPEFLNWVRDHTVSTDWYLRPNEDNVYR